MKEEKRERRRVLRRSTIKFEPELRIEIVGELAPAGRYLLFHHDIPEANGGDGGDGEAGKRWHPRGKSEDKEAPSRDVPRCSMALCVMPHIPCAMRHAPCAMRHAPCAMRHAPCAMHHAPILSAITHYASYPVCSMNLMRPYLTCTENAAAA